MIEKHTNLVETKVNNIMLEKRLVTENNKMLVCDQITAYNDKLFKRKEFIQVNNMLKQDRQDRNTNFENMKANEKISHFPFTHGEFIDQKRVQN